MFSCRLIGTGEQLTIERFEDVVRIRDVGERMFFVDPALRVADEGARGQASSASSLIKAAGAIILVRTDGVVQGGPLDGQRVWLPAIVEAIEGAGDDAHRPFRTLEASIAALHEARLDGSLKPSGYTRFRGRIRITRSAFGAALAAWQARHGRYVAKTDHAIGSRINELDRAGSCISIIQASLHGAGYGKVVEIDPELVPSTWPFQLRLDPLEDSAQRGGKPPRKTLETLRYNIYRRQFVAGDAPNY